MPWIMGLMVLGICAAISFCWAKRSSKDGKGLKRPPSRTPYSEDDSPDIIHPMIRTTTIKDMIDLTTSGSGSGKYLSLFFVTMLILFFGFV